MSSKRPLVSVRSLCKDFRRPNGTIFPVLEGINLDILDDEFLTILGLSGSGKSTLLHCMAGLLTPDRGQVVFAEPPLENAQQTSLVFQSFALFPWLTVRQNVEVALQHIPRQERTQRVDRILELVGVQGFDDCYPRELSNGVKKLVSVCRAMVSDPMVLFMDEPFNGLDSLTEHSLLAEIARLWVQPDRKIRSVVVATHSLREAVLLADRIVILGSNPGAIIRILDVPLPRPRNPNSAAFQDFESYLEKTFGELHLDKFTGGHDFDHAGVDHHHHDSSARGGFTTPYRTPKIRPLINTSLVLVEGLVIRLSSETEPMDLYDLCDDMGQSVDQMLPAVASAELLGFISTPGTDLVLTEFGHAFALEQDSLRRRAMFRQACLRLPLISSIYSIVKNKADEGLEKSVAIEQIVMMLPFEDPDLQFDALLRWSRHADLLTYDAAQEMLFAEE